MLNKRQQVRENIDNLGENINVLSQIFYRELFHLNINLKQIFPGSVVTLNRKFANMLAVFKNTKHLEKVSSSVEKMGERHLSNYGVKVEHFEQAQEALLVALLQYFGDEFNAELEEAWRCVFQEVADIMIGAMNKVVLSNTIMTGVVEEKSDDHLLANVNGIEGVRAVHQHFYDILFEEPWLKKFFYGKSKEILIDKQTQFMVAAFGGENHYRGDTPAFIHMHMYITDEMSDLRQSILRDSILSQGFSITIANQWLQIDDSFRSSIVKQSVDECVLKCQGQMPIVAPKPEAIKPNS